MAKAKKKDWRTGKTDDEIAAIIKKRTRTAKRNRKKKAKLLEGTVAVKKVGKKVKIRREDFVGIDDLRGARDDRYYVQVSFKNSPGQFYTYLTDIPGIAKGDKLVVLAPGGYEVVSVQGVSLHKPASARGYAMKWIVDKVDTDAYKEREQIEQRKAVLRSRIEERKKDRALERSNKALTNRDPELAALEREWETLA